MNRYIIKRTSKFLKDLKNAKKRGKDLSKLDRLVSLLVNGEPLDSSYKDHALVGNFIGYRECHIEPDWLLIYKISSEELILVLSRTGSHSDLF